MAIETLLFVFLASFLCLYDTIHVKLIPELINGVHYGRVPECEIPCEFSADPLNFDAEFYIVGNDGNVHDVPNYNEENRTARENSVRILGSQEGQHYQHFLNIEFLNQDFQATSLQDRRSDIPWVAPSDMDKLKAVEKAKDPQPKATFIARNCETQNNRIYYVRAIDEVIGVVSPSICMNNTEWPQCGEIPCTKLEVIRNYKFHLAFESANFPGSATENIYEAMEAGVVPVYLGTRDVAEAVPKGSYIDASDFDTPNDLANYLKEVLDNETMYNSYFEWKYKPFDAEFEEINRVLWEVDHYCRVCYYVDAMKRGVGWNHLYQKALDRIPLRVTNKTNESTEIGQINDSSQLDLSPNGKDNDCAPSLHFSNKLLLLAVAVVIFMLFQIKRMRYIIRNAFQRLSM